MTDPIVEALLGLVETMRKLTAFIESINQRLYKVEDKLAPRIPTASESNARFNREN